MGMVIEQQRNAMGSDDRRLTSRRSLLAVAGVGILGNAGCLGFGSEDGGGPEPHLGVCELHVLCTGDESSEYAVDVEVIRDGERVYDETHSLAGRRSLLFQSSADDWLGGDVRHRITVDPAVVDGRATYDSAEESDYPNCHGYLVTFDETGLEGGPVHQERV